MTTAVLSLTIGLTACGSEAPSPTEAPGDAYEEANEPAYDEAYEAEPPVGDMEGVLGDGEITEDVPGANEGTAIPPDDDIPEDEVPDEQ